METETNTQGEEEMKIALSGSGSTGKTTLATEVSKKYGVTMIPEFAREVADEMGIVKIRDMNSDQAFEFQSRILSKKMELEDSNENFIADRSTADNIAYYLRWCCRDLSDDQNEEYVNRCLSQLRKYDEIFLLPWQSLEIVDDGFRSIKAYYQYEIHCTIIGILRDNDIPYTVIGYNDLRSRVELIGTYFEKVL